VAMSRARIAQMLAVVRWVDMTGAALTLKAVAGEKWKEKEDRCWKKKKIPDLNLLAHSSKLTRRL